VQRPFSGLETSGKREYDYAIRQGKEGRDRKMLRRRRWEKGEWPRTRKRNLGEVSLGETKKFIDPSLGPCRAEERGRLPRAGRGSQEKPRHGNQGALLTRVEREHTTYMSPETGRKTTSYKKRYPTRPLKKKACSGEGKREKERPKSKKKSARGEAEARIKKGRAKEHKLTTIANPVKNLT